MTIYAFPIHPDVGSDEKKGMLLRDYFAAQIVPAYLGKGYNISTAEIAELAYKVADALMEVRGN